MKKTYIKPNMECINLQGGCVLNSVSGDGLNVSISSEGATSEAESRGGRGFGDDE